MRKAERVIQVLAATDTPLTAVEMLARDPKLGDLQALRVSLCNYVRYDWLTKAAPEKPIRYSLHPDWRRRVPFAITETAPDNAPAVA